MLMVAKQHHEFAVGFFIINFFMPANENAMQCVVWCLYCTSSCWRRFTHLSKTPFKNSVCQAKCLGDDLPTFRRPHLKTVCVRQSANANIIAIYSTKAVIDEKKASLRKMRLCVSVPYSKSFDFPIGVLKASIGAGYASAPKTSEVINE